MMLTIKARIVASYTLLFGLMLGGFAYLIYQNTRHNAIAKIDALLESHADKVSTEVEEEFRDGTFPASHDILDLSTRGLDDVRLQLFDSSGEALLSESSLWSRLWRYERTARKKRRSTTVEIYDENYRLLALPLRLDDKARLSLVVVAPLEDVEEDLANLRLLFLIAIPSALLIAAIAAYAIIRRSFRPISRIIETSRGITAVDLSLRIDVPPARDEVRLLAETLNGMIARLAAAFQTQKQFVADASHEIRTPLTIVRAELEFAERTDDLGTVRESIRIALSETDHLAALSRSLLLLAGLDSSSDPFRLRPVQLDGIVGHCLERIAPFALGKDIAIERTIEGPIRIDADGDLLDRAVMNLLENAVKYTQSGGAITVSLRTEGRAVRLDVTDNGPGIAAADLPFIFERFHRSGSARAAGEGHGLGLAIVKRIVELHGGSVEVESRPGEGSVFTVRLPRGGAGGR